jgi:DNA-binding NtrC family response regulator
MPDDEVQRPIVLAVDDDLGVLDALHLVLEDHYNVLDARDGPTALSIVEAQRIDLILLDLLIDGIDGIEILRQLRAGGSDVPVVILSAINTAWTAATAMRLGAFDYVTKPFDETDLLATIAGAMHPRAELADFAPTQASPRILLVGCQIGLAATTAAALWKYAQVEILHTTADALASRVSPDVIVFDIAETDGDLDEVLAGLRVRFPLAPTILTNVPARRAANALRAEAQGFAVVPAPACLRELLHQIAMQLRPSLSKLPLFSPLVLNVLESVSTGFATVSLHGLGSTMGRSPYYLSHLFREETGITLRTYLNRVRISAAQQLLRDTPDKIDTVATLVGLHDASHLSRLFLKYSGRRPGDFRRSPTPN